MSSNKDPKNIAYTNTGQDRDYNVYTEEFLGGADAYIYIDGQRAKDISAIQYSIREQQKPIYSYASRTYNDVAVGVRIVQGLIKVPVRNTSTNENLSFEASEYVEQGTYNIEYTPPDWVYDYSPSRDNNQAITYNLMNNEDELKVDKNIGKTIVDTNVLYEPFYNSHFIKQVSSGVIFNIIDEINDYYLIENEEVSGYILKGDVAKC